MQNFTFLPSLMRIVWWAKISISEYRNQFVNKKIPCSSSIYSFCPRVFLFRRTSLKWVFIFHTVLRTIPPSLLTTYSFRYTLIIHYTGKFFNNSQCDHRSPFFYTRQKFLNYFTLSWSSSYSSITYFIFILQHIIYYFFITRMNFDISLSH